MTSAAWVRRVGWVAAGIALAGCAARRAEAVPAPQTPIWQVVTAGPASTPMREGVATPFAIVRFDKAAFDGLMRGAGLESDPKASGVVITLPMPDGTFERFRVKESPTLAPELAAAFPDIKTYAGQGLDDPAATTRFGWTAAGFHAIVLTGTRGNMFIDTWAPGTLDVYISYRKGGTFLPR